MPDQHGPTANAATRAPVLPRPGRPATPALAPPGGPAPGGLGIAAPPMAVAARRLRSSGELTGVLARLDRSTSRELLEMIPSGAGVAAALQSCRDEDLETLRRGVTCRLIVESACADIPELHAEIEHRHAAGALVRVVDRSASWFRLFDRAAAVLPRSACLPSHALVVHEDTVIGNLHALFTRTWGQSTELAEAGPAPGRCPERDRQVLELLSGGTTDEVAARRMDVSVRTYRRYVAGLMDRLGAISRFQAGVLAADRGWI